MSNPMGGVLPLRAIRDGQIFEGTTVGTIPFTVRAATGQTASVFVVEQNNGTDLFSVDASGNVSLSGSINAVINETVTGNSSITGTLTVAGISTFNGNTVIGNAQTDTLNVYALSTFHAPVNLSSDLSISGTLLIASGTASAPSLAFIVDSDTGIYRSAANTIAFTTAGAQTATLSATAFTKILTTAASINQIMVRHDDNTDGTSHAQLVMQAGGASGGNPQMRFSTAPAGGTSYVIGIDNDVSDTFVLSQGTALGTNNLLSITTGGNVTFIQAASTGGNPIFYTFTGGAHLDLANAETSDVIWDIGRTVNFVGGGGAVATQRTFIIEAPTFTGDLAQTFTSTTLLDLASNIVSGANITQTTARILNLGAAVGGAGTTTNTIGIDIANQSLAGSTASFALNIASQTANATTTRAIEIAGTGVNNAIRLGASPNIYSPSAEVIRFMDSTDAGGLVFTMTAAGNITLNTENTGDIGIVFQNQTFTAGAAHDAVIISPTWATENFNHFALRVTGTQNGVNTQVLAGISVQMTKATGATLLTTMRGIDIEAPVVTGSVTDADGIFIANQGTAGITNPRAIRLAGTGASNAIEFGDLTLIYNNTGETLRFFDSTNARGLEMTLTAAGNQTLAATAGEMVFLQAGVGNSAFIFGNNAGARTAALSVVTFNGTAGAAAGGTLFDINVTQTGAGASPLFDIDVTALYTGEIFSVVIGAVAYAEDIINIDLGNTQTAAQLLVLDAGDSARTTDAIQITDNTTSTGDVCAITVAGAAGSGAVFDIDVGAVTWAGDILNLDLGATSTAGQVAVLAGGAAARTTALVELNDAGTSTGLGLDLNKTGGSYVTAVGWVDLVRSGNFTGVNTETAIDFRIAPSFTLTEPGAGGFVYYLMQVDMSGISVTAAAGTSTLVGMRVVTNADADVGTNYGILIDSVGSAFVGTQLYLDLGATSTTGGGIVVNGGAAARTSTLVALNDLGTSTGIGLDINKTGGSYVTAVGYVDIVRSGNFTGVDTETAIDFRIAPSFTLTEPAAGTFNYYGASIDMTGIAVTAGAGTTLISALTLTASADADIGRSRSLVLGGSNAQNSIQFGTATTAPLIYSTGAEVIRFDDSTAARGITFTLTAAGNQTIAATAGTLTLTAPSIGVATGTSLAATGAISSSSASAGIGYATGAGGIVTQGAGSGKTTAVTLSTITGEITMDGAALAGDTTVTFTLTNTAIAATDHVLVDHVSAGTLGAYTVTADPAAGSASISVRNITTGSLSEAIVLKFTVIKAVTA